MKKKIYKNGLVLLYQKNTVANIDSFQINVLTGSALEKSDELGINHLVEHLMFKASYKRTTTEISEELEREGAMVNACTNYDIVKFYFNCLPNKISRCAEIYADMLFNKNLDQHEFDKEKAVVCQEIAMYKDDYEATNESNYFETFVGLKDVAGTIDSVEKITLNKVKKFIEKRYVPANMVISVCSHLSFNKIKKIVNEYFGKVENKADYIDLRTVWNNKTIKVKNTKDVLKVKKNTAQVQVLHGFYLPIVQPSLITFGKFIVSGGLSSILFREVREAHGLCYGIHANENTFYTNRFNINNYIFSIKSSMEVKNIDSYLKVLDHTIFDLPRLMKDSDIERAINVIKTIGLKASTIASNNAYRYLNPNIKHFKSNIIKEIKYIEKHAKELAVQFVNMLADSKYNVSMLGNIKGK